MNETHECSKSFGKLENGRRCCAGTYFSTLQVMEKADKGNAHLLTYWASAFVVFHRHAHRLGRGLRYAGKRAQLQPSRHGEPRPTADHLKYPSERLCVFIRSGNCWSVIHERGNASRDEE